MTSLNWPPAPLPLAWHPTIPAAKPDPALFTAPRCQGSSNRAKGGLWTSPMMTQHHSFWSVYHDRNELNYQLVREGWALAWPHRDRTAIIDTPEDLKTLCDRFLCTEHHTFSGYASFASSFLCHDDPLDPDTYAQAHDCMTQPPLDYPAMTAAGIDALYLSPAGKVSTKWANPGTSLWDCPTVLWLAPAFTVVEPITTDAFEPDGFIEALKQALERFPSTAPGTPAGPSL